MASSSPPKTKQCGGLRSSNLKQIDSPLICEHCHQILLYPTQLGCCGARLCKHCGKYGLSNSEPFFCTFCSTNLQKKQLLPDRAIERQLKLINIECHKCEWNGLYSDYIEHLQLEHPDYVCSDCDQRFGVINLFEEHQNEVCEKRIISCNLPGCMTSTRRSEMRDHCISEIHQRILLTKLIEHFASHLNIPLSSDHSNEEMEVYRREIQTLEAIIQEPIDGSVAVQNQMQEIKRKLNEIKFTETNFRQLYVQLVQMMNAAVEKYEECSKVLDESENTANEIRDAISKIDTLVLNDQSIVVFSCQHTSSSSSYSFKTSICGHRFICRIAANSKNDRKGFLSVFLTLCRSEYDPILKYPFIYDFHFRLFDQTKEQKHHTAKFSIGPESKVFERPRSDTSEEVGIEDFAPLDYLTKNNTRYVKDGIYFVGVYIDFLQKGSYPL